MTNLKKAELHVHLEGSITPQLAEKLARRNKLTLPPGLIASDGVSYLSKDFLDFLKVYDTLAAVIKQPQDYYDITFDYLKKTAEHQGIYVPTGPQTHRAYLPHCTSTTLIRLLAVALIVEFKVQFSLLDTRDIQRSTFLYDFILEVMVIFTRTYNTERLFLKFN